MTGRQVINAAFNKIGVKVAEQALQAQEFQDGKDALNLMMKSWQAQGLHLWSKEEGVLFLDVGKQIISLALLVMRRQLLMILLVQPQQLLK